MAAQVPDDVADKRLQELQNLLREQQEDFNQQKVGQTLPVLFDRTGRYDGQIHGRSPYMQAVHVTGDPRLIGKEIMVKIEGKGLNSLHGRVVLD